MGVLHFKKEEIILEKEKADNGVTFFNKSVLGPEQDCPMSVGISEYFADINYPEFSHDEYGDFCYIIVGEMDFESSDGDKIHATQGDIVWLPLKKGLKMKIYTIKYGKILWCAYPALD